MRLLLLTRAAWAAGLLLLLLGSPASAQDFVPPDLTRFTGTWLWVESQGLVATSTPQVKGASRTLQLQSDLMVTTLDFDGWYETYEKRMLVSFEGPDTLDLVGVACASCPEHAFVRGRSALFTAEVRRGQGYRRGLWDGLSFELRPRDHGWEMTVLDSARGTENLARITTSAASGPDPRLLEGAQFRESSSRGAKGKASKDGPAWLKVRRFQFSRVSARKDAAGEGEDLDPPGHGTLTVEHLKLSKASAGTPQEIESIRFTTLIEEVRGWAGTAGTARDST
ncbi:MAG: hypothetical protein E6K75_07135 [Candidatus Eisenbacteria bacterium]|uniref:Lipocalin-like domain-containing protein n=1 Tax=Eiseniibacteriota bacterium TaxID=2212470 RepID=A0A538T0Y3_UNCEI|nr:MAG: hypothetical protein E6K75_07135 [Candidatus Eisenbacteria bacterium]